LSKTNSLNEESNTVVLSKSAQNQEAEALVTAFHGSSSFHGGRGFRYQGRGRFHGAHFANIQCHVCLK